MMFLSSLYQYIGRQLFRLIAIPACLSLLTMTSIQAQETNAPKVVVTIKPLELIAAAITEGITTPELLLQPGTSPHDYSLRPSDLRLIATADVVFWIGEDMETFLIGPLDRHVDKHRAIALMDAPGIHIENFLSADREDVQQELKQLTHSHGHDHGSHDPHIWLDPDNASAMARIMMTTLSEIDKTNASSYENNYLRFIDRLKASDAVNEGILKNVYNRGFFVFHDAWGYFTRHYGLKVIDVFTINPEQPPGARHMVQLRQELIDAGKTCVFREPQFQPAYLDAMINNLNIKVGVLDPLASDDKATPDAYPKFLENLAVTIEECLTAAASSKPAAQQP